MLFLRCHYSCYCCNLQIPWRYCNYLVLFRLCPDVLLPVDPIFVVIVVFVVICHPPSFSVFLFVFFFHCLVPAMRSAISFLTENIVLSSAALRSYNYPQHNMGSEVADLMLGNWLTDYDATENFDAYFEAMRKGDFCHSRSVSLIL